MADRPKQARVLFQPLISGTWQNDERMVDYRAEWLSRLLVERGTWHSDTEEMHIGDVVVAAPGYVWFRFWLPEPDQVVEKYFDARGEALGMYVPICTPLTRDGNDYQTQELILGIWLDPDRRVAILYENTFEEAVRRAILNGEEIDLAEARIRELTAAIHREEFPPPLVRNFEINVKRP